MLELKGSQLIGKADIVHNLTSTALLLMPLFKRGTLHDALQRRAARNEPFSNQEALRLFLQVSANRKYRQRLPPDPRGHYKTDSVYLFYPPKFESLGKFKNT